MPKKKSTTTNSFAKDFAELEKIIASFEKEDLDLDDSMQQFERGLQLAEELKKTLATVENKIETLKNKYTAEE